MCICYCDANAGVLSGKKKSWPCFVLCTQDFWKSKEKPFLWLTQLKSSCHSNVRSQLSCFCFILNKLFLLRKMFFCLEVNWRQTFDPFVCSRGVTCCSDLVCPEQEAGRPSFWLIAVCPFWRITSVTVTPLCLQRRGSFAPRSSTRWGHTWCCWLARKKPGRQAPYKPHHSARVGGFAGLKSRSCWHF